VIAEWAGNPNIRQCTQEQFAYLDIETTGLMADGYLRFPWWDWAFRSRRAFTWLNFLCAILWKSLPKCWHRRFLAPVNPGHL